MDPAELKKITKVIGQAAVDSLRELDADGLKNEIVRAEKRKREIALKKKESPAIKKAQTELSNVRDPYNSSINVQKKRQLLASLLLEELE